MAYYASHDPVKYFAGLPPSDLPCTSISLRCSCSRRIVVNMLVSKLAIIIYSLLIFRDTYHTQPTGTINMPVMNARHGAVLSRQPQRKFSHL